MRGLLTAVAGPFWGFVRIYATKFWRFFFMRIEKRELDGEFI